MEVADGMRVGQSRGFGCTSGDARALSESEVIH